MGKSDWFPVKICHAAHASGDSAAKAHLEKQKVYTVYYKGAVLKQKNESFWVKAIVCH